MQAARQGERTDCLKLITATNVAARSRSPAI
jgi:hypothetical protein